jgi:hypothetical protein
MEAHSPICTSYVAEMKAAHHQAQLFIGKDGVLQTFCPGWS